MNKKLTRRFVVFLSLCMLLAPCALAFDVVEPSSSFYVADYADVLLPETEEYIVNCNNSLAAQTGAQLVVVTVDFLDGAAIEEYSTKLFNQWKIGDAEKQNGLLVLLAVGELDYWATQGTGISASPGLTSGLLDEYLNTYLEPDFKAADYDSGVKKLFDALIEWYARYYSVTIVPTPAEQIAPEGFEILPASDDDGFSGIDTEPEDNFSHTREVIGKIAGTFLIVLLIAAVIAAVVLIVPRYVTLRRQGYRYSVFNRAFWSKRHRPPPPAAARRAYIESTRPHVTTAAPPPPPANEPRGGFGSGSGLRRNDPPPPPPADRSRGGFGSGSGSLRGRTSSGSGSRTLGGSTRSSSAPRQPSRAGEAKNNPGSRSLGGSRTPGGSGRSAGGLGGRTRGGGAGRSLSSSPKGGGGSTRGGGAGRR